MIKSVREIPTKNGMIADKFPHSMGLEVRS